MSFGDLILMFCNKREEPFLGLEIFTTIIII